MRWRFNSRTQTPPLSHNLKKKTHNWENTHTHTLHLIFTFQSDWHTHSEALEMWTLSHHRGLGLTFVQICVRLLPMGSAGPSHSYTWHFNTRVFLSCATYAKSLKHRDTRLRITELWTTSPVWLADIKVARIVCVCGVLSRVRALRSVCAQTQSTRRCWGETD